MQSHKKNITENGILFSPDIVAPEGRIFIYGASVHGEKIFEYLEGVFPEKIQAYIDGNKKGSFRGLPIISPAEISTTIDPRKDICVVAPNYYDEMSTELQKHGITRIYNSSLLYNLLRIFEEEQGAESSDINYYDKISDLFFAAFYHYPGNIYEIWKSLVDVPYLKKYNDLASYEMAKWFSYITSRNLKLATRHIDHDFNKEPVVISIAVWGEEYFAMFQRQFLPCMLAPGNLPSLSDRKVVLDLTLYEDFIEEFECSEIYKLISEHCEIAINPLPKHILQIISKADRFAVGLKFNLYGSVHNASMLYAFNNKGIVFNLAPDNLHSENELSKSIEFIDEGFQAIAFTCVRAYFPALVERYKELTGIDLDNSPVIQLSGEDISWISAEFFETDMLKFLISDLNTEPYEEIACERGTITIFPEKRALELRSFNIHVLAMHHSFSERVNEVSSVTVCHYLLNLIQTVSDSRIIKIVDDLNDFGMVDIVNSVDQLTLPKDSEKGIPHKLLTVDNFIEGTAKTSPFYRWLFAHVLHMRTKKGPPKIWYQDANGYAKPHELEIPNPLAFSTSTEWAVRYYAGCLLFDLNGSENLAHDLIFKNLSIKDQQNLQQFFKTLSTGRLVELKDINRHPLFMIAQILSDLLSNQPKIAMEKLEQISLAGDSWWVEIITVLTKSMLRHKS